MGRPRALVSRCMFSLPREPVQPASCRIAALMTTPPGTHHGAPGTSEAGLLAIRDPEARPHAAADWRARLELLRRELARHERVVVAYSGGVDSSLLLAVAHEQLGDRAIAVIGVSESYASRELELALA